MDLQQLLRNTIDTRLVLAGLLFSIGFGLVAEATIMWLAPLGPGAYVIAGSALFGLGVLVGRGWLTGLATRTWFEDLTGNPVRPAKVLITTSGVGTHLGANATLVPALHRLGALELVVLLHTDDEHGTSGKATFMAFGAELGLEHVLTRALPTAATHDPRYAIQTLEKIIEELEDQGYGSEDMIFDLTSGTKCFTVAATLVGASGARRLCYAHPAEHGDGYEVSEIDLVYQVRQRGPFAFEQGKDSR